MAKQLVILSSTGIVHGRGTGPWKWVSNLSDAERAAVRDKSAVVFIRDAEAWHYTQSGYKVVHFRSGKFYHREPTAKQVAAFNRHFNKGA